MGSALRKVLGGSQDNTPAKQAKAGFGGPRAGKYEIHNPTSPSKSYVGLSTNQAGVLLLGELRFSRHIVSRNGSCAIHNSGHFLGPFCQEYEYCHAHRCWAEAMRSSQNSPSTHSGE